MKLKCDGQYLRYKKWYIYEESMGGLFTHCFFHEDYDGADEETHHLQGTAQNLRDAVEQIEEIDHEQD